MFIHESDDDITIDELHEFIALHQNETVRYDELWKQYTSRPPILDLEEKPNEKPDNRLVVNFGKYLVDTFNGYFSGIPVKISHEDADVNEKLNDFWRYNNMDDTFSELSKLTSIYGVSYMYIWQDEDAYTRATYAAPYDTFVIYDDSIDRQVKYGVRYKNTDDGVQGKLFTRESIIDFGETYTNEESHYYPLVPVIPFVENEEQQSLIRPVETMVNAYNKALSEKKNDIDYFSDAYLSVLGAELDEETLKNIRDNRVINVASMDGANITVEFLNKPDGDTSQENFLNRVERLIYHTSMVANINDETFGNSSGTALEFKLQPMKNLSGMKERKFTKSLNDLFKCYTSLPTNLPANKQHAWIDIEYKFIRNIPRNVQDEAETARNLEGVVSKRTQLGTLSVVDNVDTELEYMEEERELPSYDFELAEGDGDA